MAGEGYAIIDASGLDVATVSPDRRGAIVNWLVRNGLFISARMSDEAIELAWEDRKGTARCVMVDIEEQPWPVLSR
jgi:hypothetical protein